MSDLMLFMLFGAVVGLASTWLCRRRQAVWSVAVAGTALVHFRLLSLFELAVWGTRREHFDVGQALEPKPHRLGSLYGVVVRLCGVESAVGG